MNQINSDFSKARVGDKVWDIRYGDGQITGLSETDSHPYHIVVGFPGIGRYSYTKTGRHNENDSLPSLYWAPITFDVPPPPKRMVKRVARIWIHKDAWKFPAFAVLRVHEIYSLSEEAGGHYIPFEYEVEVEE